MAKLKKKHKKAFVKPFGYEKKLEGRSQDTLFLVQLSRANQIKIESFVLTLYEIKLIFKIIIGC